MFSLFSVLSLTVLATVAFSLCEKSNGTNNKMIPKLITFGFVHL